MNTPKTRPVQRPWVLRPQAWASILKMPVAAAGVWPVIPVTPVQSRDSTSGRPVEKKSLFSRRGRKSSHSPSSTIDGARCRPSAATRHPQSPSIKTARAQVSPENSIPDCFSPQNKKTHMTNSSFTSSPQKTLENALALAEAKAWAVTQACLALERYERERRNAALLRQVSAACDQWMERNGSTRYCRFRGCDERSAA